MTNVYGVIQNPVITTMADKSKGSVKNRANCATAHIGNSLKTTAMTAGVLGGAYVTAYHPEKLAELADKAKNLADKGRTAAAPYATKLANSSFGMKLKEIFQKAKATSIAQKAKGYISKLAGKLQPLAKEALKTLELGAKSLVNVAKAHPVIAGVTLTALTLIGLNHAFKAGQIDQKYTDKAKYENA